MVETHDGDRWSRFALWSSSLASLSVPVLLITAIGHRGRLLDTTSAYGSMAVGFTLAGLAVITAVAAFANIWQDGRRGGGRATWGMLLGLLVLSVPAYAAWKLVNEPRLSDISTSLENPPQFRAALSDRRPGDALLTRFGDLDADLQRLSHPDIVSRFYPVGPSRVFEEAQAIIDRRGWDVLQETPPDEETGSGTIEAVAVTLIFGFRQDVVLRIEAQGEGTLVDMRSAARRAAHDLGANAGRIRSFFGALDSSLQGITAE